MADKVEVDIPGVGKIEAVNAATETTLRELVNAIKGLQKDSNKNSKDQQKQNKQPAGNKGPDYKDLNQANQGAAKAANAGSKGMNLAAGAGRMLGGAMRKVGNVAGAAGTALGSAARSADILVDSMKSMTASITDTLDQLGGLKDSVSAAATTLRHIPVVGSTLSNVFKAVADSASDVVGAFQTAASVGATFNGSVQDMSRAASGAGMTLDNFGKLLQQNGENLMLLGGTTEAGAKRFAGLSKSLVQGDLGGQLLRMGYSTQEVNDGMLKYAGMMGKTGALSKMSNDQLIRGSADYLKEMDALAKITGESRQAKQQEMDALMKDAKVRAALAGIEDPEQQRKMQAYILSFPKEAQGAIADMIATGNITTEESIRLNTMLPGAAAQAMEFGRTLKAGGKITDAGFNQARNAAIREAQASVKRNQALGLYSQEFGAAYVATANIAAQSIDGYSKAMDEQAKATKDQNLAEELGKAQQQIAQVSNEFQLFLAQSGMLSALMDAFKAVASFASAVLMPAFSLIGGAINAVVPMVTDFLIPAFQILGDWISTAVVPIFQAMGDIISSYLMPTFDSVGSVLEDYFEPALYAISDFIEDNLEPIMATLGIVIGTMVIGKMYALGAALVAQIMATWSAVAPFVALAGAVIAATWPIIAIGAAIYAAVKIIKNWTDVLTIGKETMSMVFSYIKTGIFTLFKGILSLINKIPGFRGDFDDAIKGLDDKLKSEEDSRKKSAEKIGQAANNMFGKTAEEQRKADDKKAMREEKRREREERRQARLQGREAELLKKKEEQQQKEDEKNAEASQDMTDPISMLKSFAERNKSAYTQEAKALDEKEMARREMEAAQKQYNDAREKQKKATDQKEAEAAEKAVAAAEERVKKAQELQNKADKSVGEAVARMKAAKEGKDPGAPKAEAQGRAPVKIDPESVKNLGEGVGRVAARFESGGDAGRISSGAGDFGGKSYGAFQLASNTGDVSKFLKASGYDKAFEGMKVGSEAFDAKWKELAKSDENFAKSQQAYAKQKYYDPQSAKLQKSGIDLSGRGEAVQEAILSTANQYGANTELIIKALKGKDTAKMSDKDIINAIQDYKAENVKGNFRSSSRAVQEGVAKRIEQERSMLLGIDAGGAGDTGKYAGGEKSSDGRPSRQGRGRTEAAGRDMPNADQAFQSLVTEGINPTTLAFKQLSTEMPKTMKSMYDGMKVAGFKPVQEGPGTLDKIKTALGLGSKELKGQAQPKGPLPQRVDPAVVAQTEALNSSIDKLVAEKLAKLPKNMREDVDVQNSAREEAELELKAKNQAKAQAKGTPQQEKIKEQLALSMAAKASAERVAKRAESNAKFATNDRVKSRWETQARRAEGEAALQEAKIKKLEEELKQTQKSTAQQPKGPITEKVDPAVVAQEQKKQSIGTLQQEKIKEQMALSMAAKASAERAAKRAESDAKFATNDMAKQHHLTQAENAKGEAALQEAKIKKLESELGLSKPNQVAGDLAKSKQAQTPTSAQAAQAVTDDKKKQETKKIEVENKPTVPKEIKPTQESAETLLAQLNTKLDELIMINRKVADLNDSQLRVQKNMGSDLYA